jgi:putative MFS transporter
MWLASRDAGRLEPAPLGALAAPEFRGRFAFVAAMWLLQVVPIFALFTYAPVVLSALGLGDQSSPAGSIAITAAFAAGSLLSLPLVEYWGRRPLCIAGFAIGVPAFALLPFVNVPLVVTCFLVYAIAIGAASGLEIVYPGELFPTRVRGTAVGAAAAVSRIGAFAGTFALPIVLAKFGAMPVMMSACALSLLGFALSWRWAPETKGRAIS